MNRHLRNKYERVAQPLLQEANVSTRHELDSHVERQLVYAMKHALSEKPESNIIIENFISFVNKPKLRASLDEMTVVCPLDDTT